MKHLLIILTFLLFALFVSSSACAQSSVDSMIAEDTKFELANDTLISQAGLKIYHGQKFTLGYGVGANGR